MSWELVGQVLVLLAGAGALDRWMRREPRPRAARGPRLSAAERSLEREADALTASKVRLLTEYERKIACSLPASAQLAWAGAERIELRLKLIRDSLEGYRNARIETELVD